MGLGVRRMKNGTRGKRKERKTIKLINIMFQTKLSKQNIKIR